MKGGEWRAKLPYKSCTQPRNRVWRSVKKPYNCFDKTQNKTLNLQKNRPNVGLARRNQYWPAVRQLNVKNFTVKHRKQPHSCKINEIKLKFSLKSVKENKAGKRKTDDFPNAELFQVQISCWFTILLCALPKKLYAFKTPWLTGLCYYL